MLYEETSELGQEVLSECNELRDLTSQGIFSEVTKSLTAHKENEPYKDSFLIDRTLNKLLSALHSDKLIVLSFSVAHSNKIKEDSPMKLGIPNFLRKSFIATQCGHETKLQGSVAAFEKTATLKMKKDEDGSVDYCLECIGNMSIKCAWCENVIFIGSPITLYTPMDKNFSIPEHAVVYKNEPLQLVGCLGWDCALTGADRAGFWLPDEDGKGHVHRVPTAIETMMAAGGSSGVLISDTHDINEAHNPHTFPLK